MGYFQIVNNIFGLQTAVWQAEYAQQIYYNFKNILYISYCILI